MLTNATEPAAATAKSLRTNRSEFAAIFGIFAGQIDQIRRVNGGRHDTGGSALGGEVLERRTVDRADPVRFRVAAEKLQRGAPSRCAYATASS